jgi:hypothetical protein
MSRPSGVTEAMWTKMIDHTNEQEFIMAAKVRVLVQTHWGTSYHAASEEGKKEMREKQQQFLTSWKEAGIELVGDFHAYGDGVGGYSHHLLFDVDDLETVTRMNSDIFQAGIYQRHAIHVGSPVRSSDKWAGL